MNPQHANGWIPEWGFGDRLRKVRTELGMNQDEFAAKLDLKSSSLAAYETGRANPRSRDLPALAARLELLSGVPRAWFMGWETKNPHPRSPGEGAGPVASTVKSRQFNPVVHLFGKAV